MRFKQDAVPGLEIHMHFTPTEIGEYEIACAELCGLGHYKMHGMLHVVSQEDFDKWLAAREAEKHIMATSAPVHAHAAPQGFIRKYIFSLDHKVIGIQYYFLALTAVFVGMFFVAADAHPHDLADGGSAAGG